MFQSARLKLTAWYVIIIMFISLSFSVAIYRLLTNELVRFLQMQNIRQETRIRQKLFFTPAGPIFVTSPEPELIAEVEHRIRAILIVINGVILVVSGTAAYFLAGKTLRPIAEVMDEQKRFVSDASHELRTPLASLRSEIEVTLRDKTMKLPEAKKILQSNLEEVDKLQELTDGLMTLSRFQTSSNGLVFEPIPVRDIVTSATGSIAKLAKQKNITVKEEIAEGTVYGDKRHLTELFTTLLDNAIKYSHEDSEVTVVSKTTKNTVTVIVRDQGVGISSIDVPHIFDRFYRADKSRSKTAVDGYGLGLAIAKSIVDRHRGSIGVKSTLGKGTTFTVILPIGSYSTSVRHV